MTEIDPEDVECTLDCCVDEYATSLELKKAAEGKATVKEQIYELEEPIRVFLFDIPKAKYAKRNMISAIYPMTNVFLGVICTVCMIFPFEISYGEFSKSLHVPLSTFGLLYHVTPGMMALSKFFDSSHVLKWSDRRSEHIMQMLAACVFLYFGLGLFFSRVEPTYSTAHSAMGLAAIVGNLIAILTGLLAVVISPAGPKGVRGKDHLLLYIHAYIGSATYAIFIATFATGLKNEFKEWLESLFGNWICLLFIMLTIFLFFVSLIGPVMRCIANRAKAKFQKKLKKKKKREAKAKQLRKDLEKKGLKK